MTSIGDRMLVCRDCGITFVFTAGEQAFYLERGFVEPARCPNCRAARKQSRASADDGSPYATTSGRNDRRFFPATCAECGRETLVPFEPRTGRPVYCRECFNRQRVAR